MAFKIGDKVRMVAKLASAEKGVRGEVGVVVHTFKDSGGIQQITVEFPGGVRRVGMNAAQFEKA